MFFVCFYSCCCRTYFFTSFVTHFSPPSGIRISHTNPPRPQHHSGCHSSCAQEVSHVNVLAEHFYDDVLKGSQCGNFPPSPHLTSPHHTSALPFSFPSSSSHNCHDFGALQQKVNYKLCSSWYII